MTTALPYGAWHSALTAERLAKGGRRLSTCVLDERGRVYFTEGRAAEAGRNVLCRQGSTTSPDTAPIVEDLLPAPWNVRTRVHEYGGNAFVLAQGTSADDPVIYFVDSTSQRLHVFVPESGHPPRALTPEGAPWRFADLILDPRRERLICVGERQLRENAEPENCLVAIALDTGAITVLVQGNDFFASPRLCADGSQLAWLAWNHPDMPWDAAALWLAPVDTAGRVQAAQRVAGGHLGGRASACFQPDWNGRGELVFVDDRDGFWNLFVRARDGQVRALCPMDAEFGLPLWQLGMQTWGFLDDKTLVAAYTRNGTWSTVLVDVETGATTPLELFIDGVPVTAISHVCASQGVLAFVGGAARVPTSVARVEVTAEVRAAGQPQPLHAEVLRRALDDDTLTITRALAGPATAITFSTTDGDTAHAIVHHPGNASTPRLRDTLPPLLVLVHGGPTAAASTALNPAVVFWTSRGFVVAEVNYRGSTGYGRAYRERLHGQWGVRDVADCVAAARHLAQEGIVDGRRMAIRGSSAGGFTALMALAAYDVFAAAASHYGVADLEALARDTHKFESHYLERLIGPWPAARALYQARSPVVQAGSIRAPVIFFQGQDDPVVPPAQTEAIVAALQARGVPCTYLAFPGEQHGFRRAETIVSVLQAELAFYGRVFGFTPAVTEAAASAPPQSIER